MNFNATHKNHPLLAALLAASLFGGGSVIAQTGSTTAPGGTVPQTRTTLPQPAPATTGLVPTQPGTTLPPSITQSPATIVDTPSTPAAQVPGASLPARTDSSEVAFRRLDVSNAGYVTKEQAMNLSGFDAAFAANDINRDGQLSADEFRSAWMSYSGNIR